MRIQLKKVLEENYKSVLLVFLAFLAMVLASYYYVSRIVNNQMQIIGEEIMNTTETAVAANLSETSLSFSNLTQTVESMLSSGRSNEEILTFLESMNAYFGGETSPLPDFLKVYGYIRGEFLDGSGWTPPADYVPQERPWYVGADEIDTIFFSAPYLDADTGGLCISFSRKVWDRSREEYGILAIDLDMSRITDYIRGQSLANNGYGVLLNSDMHFVAHRDDSMLDLDMWQAGKGYAKLAKMLEQGETVSAQRFTDADGVDSVAFFRPVLQNWYIGLVTPRFNYYSQAYQLAAMLGILGFVLMCMLSYMLMLFRLEKMQSDEESRSKSAFLSRMSHEMRTPMNAIIGMTDIARKTDDMDQIQYCLNKVNDASSHLLGIINDVLDMSKIEAGKLELSEEDFRLDGLLDQIIGVVDFKFQEKRQSFSRVVEPPVPAVIRTDRQRLAQLLTNLLGNANKFTPEEGKISLRIEVVDGVADPDDGCTLRFTVADSGIGISEEQQSRLFHSFEQADGSISRKFGGTGLGLAISKGIVELMGGRIWVESELGQGARFVFELPVRAGNPDEAVADGKDAALPVAGSVENIFAGKRFLLAEDVAINREILMAQLAVTGVSIESAENGREACELFDQHQGDFDLVLMDIHMPEMDGYEATRHIRAMEGIPSAQTVPIIAMTADVFKEDIDQCIAAGMDDHIGKPLNIDEVMTKLQRHLLL